MGINILTTAVEVGKNIIESSTVEGVVAGFLTTLFLRHKEDVKLLEAVKAKEFEKVTSELLQSGRLSYVDLYKYRNFMNIAKRADDAIRSKQQSISEGEQKIEENQEKKFDFDWLMRFFDAVGNISNEELQVLWGKVLANEIAKPKSCSLRTLDIIRNMSPEEAKTFSVLSRYVMQSGDTYYIDSKGFYCAEDGYQECREFIRNQGLTYGEHIVPLMEAGVLSADHDLAIYINKDVNLEFHNDKIVGLVVNPNENPELFQMEAYFLTACGRELFQVIRHGDDFEADDEYALLCMKEVKRQKEQFYVGAYTMDGKEKEL